MLFFIWWNLVPGMSQVPDLSDLRQRYIVGYAEAYCCK